MKVQLEESRLSVLQGTDRLTALGMSELPKPIKKRAPFKHRGIQKQAKKPNEKFYRGSGLRGRGEGPAQIKKSEKHLEKKRDRWKRSSIFHWKPAIKESIVSGAPFT